MNRKALLSVLSFVFVIVAFFAFRSWNSHRTEESYAEDAAVIEEAEKHVKSYVYQELGVVADHFTSEIIYEADRHPLVFIRFGVGSREPMGSYCVYCYRGIGHVSVLNATKMLPPGYSYREHLEELKALFAV